METTSLPGVLLPELRPWPALPTVGYFHWSVKVPEMAYDLCAFLVEAIECLSSWDPPVSPEEGAFRSDVSLPETSIVTWVWARLGTASVRRTSVPELVSSVWVIATFGCPLDGLAFPGCHGSDRDRVGPVNSSSPMKSPNLMSRKRAVWLRPWRMSKHEPPE